MVGSKLAGVHLGDVVLQFVEGVTAGQLWPRSWRWEKPVALEASAEERDTRGFISINHHAAVLGLTAN